MPNPTFVSQVMAALGRLRTFATAALPSTPPTGQLVYDTTTDGVKVANNAGTFTAVGGGAATTITVGTTAVAGGGANRVLFEDGAQNLATDANFTYAPSVLTLPNGAAATPSLAFQGGTTNGLWSRAGTTLDFSTSATHIFEMFVNSTPFLAAGGTGCFGWTSAAAPAAAIDTGIFRTAAGIVRIGQNVATTPGWMSSASENALNAPYTNATAGFTVTNLSVTVISGRTYSFECVLFFSDSTAVDGAQFDFNGGSAGVTNFMAQAFAYNNVGGALVLTNGAVTALATAIQVTLALTTQSLIVIKGTFVPSGNGTFIVRAAQTAHSTGTLTVNRGSYLNIRDANAL